MECASKDTRSALTAPELTRLSANQPLDRSAETTRSVEFVLVHVSAGKDDWLKPGLNIMGGMQPRGPRPSISETFAEVDVDG